MSGYKGHKMQSEHFIAENNNYAAQRTLKSRDVQGHRLRGKEVPVQGECLGERGEEMAG